MTRGHRYFFFSVVFALVLVGLISKSYLLLGGALLVSLAVGIWIEKVDNKRDEKFKHHNAVHNYHH
ncbi:hypothetical protein [Effusibacillus lacus]|uniref:Uncharacterized protein n=1 Tax=Effusibacillus lacus TaxID=1348429 RepID=A0A292YR30_9BACL|nr:hypothetical protein [Effusibacillus lacus]TCS68046.1 hypothetical protein EDD64_1468 [Effusibacillus lacus]GAX90940.1 hypothetical protein EFBL_2584 [Effusibacillus lacus]